MTTPVEDMITLPLRLVTPFADALPLLDDGDGRPDEAAVAMKLSWPTPGPKLGDFRALATAVRGEAPRGELVERFVNFYPPIDGERDPHPWRTTSWVSAALARSHAQPGALAVAVRVVFEAEGKAP